MEGDDVTFNLNFPFNFNLSGKSMGTRSFFTGMFFVAVAIVDFSLLSKNRYFEIMLASLLEHYIRKYKKESCKRGSEKSGSREIERQSMLITQQISNKE
jgi:hypothetical protein